MPKDTRPIVMKFRVSESERDVIEQKMKRLGIANNAAYLRKMALDGYILTLNMPELQELISLLRYMGNNVNQMTKRVNATDRLYENDLRDIRAQQQKLWDGINALLNRLGKAI